jgi:hypothetical protein
MIHQEVLSGASFQLAYSMDAASGASFQLAYSMDGG